VAVERGRTTLAAEVERERPDLPDRRDRALYLDLTAGTLRWQAAIDARLGACLHRPLDTLAPEVRAVLRLGVYQIHYLDRVPPHAIVYESVDVTRALGQVRAAGFVNGVLRSLLRARARPGVLPVRPVDSRDLDAALAYLSITLSHPRWLVARWLDREGFDACERWCRANNAPPEVTVRPLDTAPEVMIARLRQHHVDARPATFAPGAIRLAAGGLGRLDAATRDALLVQDEASQLVACLAGTAPGERVLDACAAPGGKTAILAAAAGPAGLVVAGDRRPARIALLRATLARARAGALVVALDAEAGLPFGPVFDRVLLDAPCSGLGTLRRDPDIKWRLRPEHLPRLATAQAAMLRHAADAVRPGGTLVYATCSSEPDENDEVVDRFLAGAPHFRAEPFSAGPAPGARETIDDRGRLRTRPFAHGLDAFFAARLVRREGA
jgi:16S rRNA (cytosine967-C5)-methyltransferase